MESMPIIRAQVTLPMTSTVSADSVTNTWHFTLEDVTEGTKSAVKTALAAFYEALDTWKSNLVTWSGVRCKMFNIEDPEPRIPIDDAGLTVTSAPAGSPLPPEVAVCCSFNGDYVSGASQARRRGRVFLGPLNTAALTTDGRLSSSLVTAVATAGGTLLTASNSASTWAWIVYSPSGDTGYPVVDGWCDNAPDIQRRRGVDATTRTAFI
jgi:hypothetical protein